MYKIGLPGKLILRDYFQENRTSRRPFLLQRISFPGRPISIQYVPGEVSEELRLDGGVLHLVHLEGVDDPHGQVADQQERHHLRSKEVHVTVEIGYFDTVGEGQKCHNMRFVTISDHFSVDWDK